MGLSAVLPILHGMQLYGLATLTHTIGLRWVVLQGMLYIVGAGLYAVRPPHTTSPFPPQSQYHPNPLPIANHPPSRPASPNAPAPAPSTSGAPRTSSSTRSSCSPLRRTWSGWSRRSTMRIADVRPRGRWACCLRRGYDGGSGGRNEGGESGRGVVQGDGCGCGGDGVSRQWLAGGGVEIGVPALCRWGLS